MPLRNDSVGVATSGTAWDIGDYKLWRSIEPGVILFIRNRPALATHTETDRYQAGLSLHCEQRHGRSVTTGGSATVVLTSSTKYDARIFEQQKEQWRSQILEAGDAYDGYDGPLKFIPLPTWKATTELFINPALGKPSGGGNEASTVAGPNSFLVELTPRGAEEWAQSIRHKTSILGWIRYTYEYLRVLPRVDAIVTAQASRLFSYFFATLSTSNDGTANGSEAEISALWEHMLRDGVVEIYLSGNAPLWPNELREEIAATFSRQARQELFSTLFTPRPDIEANIPVVGDRYGLKWHSQSEAVDVNIRLHFEGWTRLMESTNTPLSALLWHLDESYINKVHLQPSTPFLFPFPKRRLDA